MKIYWTVKYSNFDDFIKYISNKYIFTYPDGHLESFRYNYEGEYLYLGVDDEFVENNIGLTFMAYIPESIKWYNEQDWIYQGEYISRKKKLDELNKIANDQ